MQSNSVHQPLRIYIDENMPKQLASAFNILQCHLNKKEGREIEVYSMKEIDEGASDINWFQNLKGKNAIILTQDRNIQRHKHERKAYEDNGIGIIFFKHQKGGMTFWDTFRHLVNHWDDIKSVCRKNNLPFAFKQAGFNKKFERWDA